MDHELSPSQTLTAWEHGRGRHPIDRSLTLLWAAGQSSGASAEQDYAALARLPLGERNARLLRLHAASFGRQVECRAACPSCAEQLEFSLDISEILALASPAAGEAGISVTIEAEGGQYSLRCHPLNSLDLAAVSGATSLAAARQELIRRCLSEYSPPEYSPLDARQPPGQPDDWPGGCQLPAEVEARLADLLAQADPLADITIALLCPQCGRAWQAPFDPGETLWSAVQVHARRLLFEVHELARAYGWSETQILAISPARRQAYLEMIPPQPGQSSGAARIGALHAV